MDNKRLKLVDFICLLFILWLAFVLRTVSLDISEFKLDEAGLARLALDLVQGKSIPLQGTGSSTGIPTAPVSVYVYAIPFFFSSNPFFATWFTAALNVLAVALCWALTRRYWGTRAAHLATLLYATAAWPVIASRKIWEPNILSLFVLAYVACGLLAFVEKRHWALTAHLVLLSIILQIHFSGLALVPLTLLLLILYYRQVDWRALCIGLGLVVISAIPFARFLLQERAGGIGNGFNHLLTRSIHIDARSIRTWWIMTTGNNIHALSGASGFREFLRSVPNLVVLRWALGALTVTGLAYWLWSALRRPHDAVARAGGIVALWAIAPAVLLVCHATPVYTHYFYVTFPAQFMAAGYVLQRASSVRWRAVRWGIVATTVGAAVAQAGVILALFSFVATHATPGGFGTPYRFQSQAIRRALSYKLPVVAVCRNDDFYQDDWASALDVLLRDKRHRLVDGTRCAVFPDTPYVLLIMPGTEIAQRVYAQAGVLDQAEVIRSRPGEEPFRTVRLDGSQRPALSPVEPPNRLANGVEVIGYRLRGQIKPGQSFEWWVAWRVLQPPANRHADYHIFSHLVDAQGKLVTQVDGPTVRLQDWNPGDLVVQVFQMNVPATAGSGPYSMRVGMYTYPELQNQLVLDVAGNPISDAVMLPPLSEL